MTCYVSGHDISHLIFFFTKKFKHSIRYYRIIDFHVNVKSTKFVTDTEVIFKFD